MNDNMTKEQEAQYIAALQQEASKMGLDPNNYDHLEATEKTLMQMEVLKIEKGEPGEEVQRKLQEKLDVALRLNVDVNTYQQSLTQIGEEATQIEKKSKTRGMIAMAVSAVVAIGAAFLTNRTAKDREWGGWRWPANIGAFLGAGAGAAYLGFLMVGKPTAKNMAAISDKMVEANAQLDEKIKPAMAQFLAQKIAEEHAQAAAEEQAKQQPAQAKTDHTPPQAQPAPAKTEEQIIADAKNKEEIAKEVDEGREVTYKSGEHAELAPTDLKDRVVSRGSSHIDAAVEQKKVAATQQHTMV